MTIVDKLKEKKQKMTFMKVAETKSDTGQPLQALAMFSFTIKELLTLS